MQKLLDNGWIVSIQNESWHYADKEAGLSEVWAFKGDKSYPDRPLGWQNEADVKAFIGTVKEFK